MGRFRINNISILFLYLLNIQDSIYMINYFKIIFTQYKKNKKKNINLCIFKKIESDLLVKSPLTKIYVISRTFNGCRIIYLVINMNSFNMDERASKSKTY